MWRTAADPAASAPYHDPSFSQPDLLVRWAPTIGRATGMWDPVLLVAERKRLLEDDHETATDPMARAALQGRISELAIAVANPRDRRVMARLFVERFSFPMAGLDADIQGGLGDLLGAPDAAKAWPVSFWLGSWDPDLLCTYLQGSLQIPYVATP